MDNPTNRRNYIGVEDHITESTEETADAGTFVDTEPTGPRQNLLRAVDGVVQGTLDDPMEQLSVLMLACALAARRVIVARSVDCNIGLNRAIRVRLIKTAVAEFEKKLRRFCRESLG